MALRTRGHDVCWASGPDGCERVKRAGFDAVSAGLSQAALGAVRAPPPRDQRAAAARSGRSSGSQQLFGEISPPAALADLLPIVRSWRPELVVNDAAELAAPIAAAVIGVPHVTRAFGALLPEVRVRRADDEVAPCGAQGLELRSYGAIYDHLYLDIYPPSLQAPAGDHLGARQLLRPVAFAGATDGRVASSEVGLVDGRDSLRFATWRFWDSVSPRSAARAT